MSRNCLSGTVCLLAVLVVGWGCSPSRHKAEADKEVYKIIDSKWDPNFGQKVNYTVQDVPGDPNGVQMAGTARSGVLSLAQAVGIATANNRDYQRQKEQLYLTALDLTLARHRFARRWLATVDAGYARGDADETVGAGGETGVRQTLAGGTQIATSIAMDWTRFLTGDPRTSLGSVLGATVTQPLLRGAGRQVAQENLTQAERNVLYQIRSFNRYRQSFVVSIVNDYYRVLQQRDAVTNAQNSYESKVELRKRLEMEAGEGRTARYQVDQAEQSELNAKDSLLRTQQAYEQRLDEFKIRLALPTDADVVLDQNELKSLEEAGITQPAYTLAEALDAAFAQRLDLANSIDSVEDAQRKVLVAANGLGADLNLVASARANSGDGTEFSRIQFQRGDYSLGVEAGLPLDRKAERNAYREALIALEQQRREYENDLDSIKLDVRQAYRKLQEEAESYVTQRKSLDLARQRVAVSPLLWEAGRANTRDLLESQDALLLAQNSLTAALVDHTIAKLNFFRDIGVLQVRPDGMWEESKHD
ncbi:MAG: TolC family protein [Planctomycetes bacterium]|mgnify:CR=1 FL=1|nr:TolC family protein [Planctomycetota bacterium]